MWNWWGEMYGFGLCMTYCAEGAIKLMDGKGSWSRNKILRRPGACLGHCPEDHHRHWREAKNLMKKQWKFTFISRSKLNLNLSLNLPVFTGCLLQGPCILKLLKRKAFASTTTHSVSQLTQWPVQLKLVPVNAPYFQDADLLIAADCVPLPIPTSIETFSKGRL